MFTVLCVVYWTLIKIPRKFAENISLKYTNFSCYKYCDDFSKHFVVGVALPIVDVASDVPSHLGGLGKSPLRKF